MKTRILKYVIATVVASIVMIITFSEKQFKETYDSRDFTEIIKSGKIKAVTEYNAVSFYVDKDTVRGFDYELLNAFAESKGIKAEISLEMSFEKRLEGVSSGKYDIMAPATATTAELKDSILFTIPIIIGKYVLIQRTDTVEGYHIEKQLDMAGKTIHTIKDSPAVMRIKNLMSEIADTICIKEIADYGTEQLMAMVSGGDIDYAVCEENTANIYMPNYNNLDINTEVGFNQFYSWGINKESPELLDSLNAWLDTYMKTKEYKSLYKRYFNNKKIQTW